MATEHSARIAHRRARFSIGVFCMRVPPNDTSPSTRRAPRRVRRLPPDVTRNTPRRRSSTTSGTREYGRLDDLGQVYLDYTGAGLYAVSQIERHSAMLTVGHLWQSAFRQSALDSFHGVDRVVPTSGAPVLQRAARCLQRRLYGQREPGTEACRRSLSIRIRGPVSPHL